MSEKEIVENIRLNLKYIDLEKISGSDAIHYLKIIKILVTEQKNTEDNQP